jgi:hypothetical protein
VNVRPGHVFLVLLVMGLLLVPLRGQEIAVSAEASVPQRRVMFTEAEMAKFRAIAAEQEVRRETYIRASEDDDIVLLEPYVVVGDDSLLIARLRRELELGGRPERLAAGLTPADRVAVLMARRVDDEFFGVGGPNAVMRTATRAEANMLYLNPLALMAAFRSGKFKNVFAAPAGIE